MEISYSGLQYVSPQSLYSSFINRITTKCHGIWNLQDCERTWLEVIQIDHLQRLRNPIEMKNCDNKSLFVRA